ncbi:unnamed protein product, partial [marine sediment metagenome]
MDVCEAQEEEEEEIVSDIWGWDYCTPANKCDAGEGDCDTDADCAEGLHCAQDTGTKYGQVSTMDVCEEEEEEVVDNPPTISISAPSSAGIGKIVSITITGTDDIDISALYIDNFGDGNYTYYSCSGTQKSCSHAFSHAYSSAGTYTIKVSARDSTLQRSTTATKTIAITTFALSAPTLNSPSSGATVSNLTPTLKWYTVSGANAYIWNVLYADSGTVTTNQVVVPSGELERGKTYSWRVMACSDTSLSNCGSWSSTRT